MSSRLRVDEVKIELLETAGLDVGAEAIVTVDGVEVVLVLERVDVEKELGGVELVMVTDCVRVVVKAVVDGKGGLLLVLVLDPIVDSVVEVVVDGEGVLLLVLVLGCTDDGVVETAGTIMLVIVLVLVLDNVDDGAVEIVVLLLLVEHSAPIVIVLVAVVSLFGSCGRGRCGDTRHTALEGHNSRECAELCR